MGGQFRRDGVVPGSPVLTDTDMKMPVAEIHRQVAVVQADLLRRTACLDLPGGALDQGPELHLVPMLAEDLPEQSFQDGGFGFEGEDLQPAHARFFYRYEGCFWVCFHRSSSSRECALAQRAALEQYRRFYPNPRALS